MPFLHGAAPRCPSVWRRPAIAATGTPFASFLPQIYRLVIF
jgi:hypothetical protein